MRLQADILTARAIPQRLCGATGTLGEEETVSTSTPCFPRGSEWRIWDLHIHTPASYHWNGPRFTTGELTAPENTKIIDEMINAGEMSDISANQFKSCTWGGSGELTSGGIRGVVKQITDHTSLAWPCGQQSIQHF